MLAVPDLAFAKRSTARELGLFLLAAFLPITVGAILATSRGGLAAHPMMVPACMLAPMLSAVLVQKLSGRRVFGPFGLGLCVGRLRWWFIGPALAFLFVAISLLLSVAISPNLVVDHPQMLRNLQHLNVPHDLSPTTQIALAGALTAFVAPFINLPIFLGEEGGWRGFMNPRLEQLFGRTGLIIGGVIWAVWHLPIILLGHNYPVHPWIGMLIWIPICIGMNVLLADLARRSRSIIPCALSHGLMNQVATLVLSLTVRQDQYLDLLHGPAGLLGLATLLLPATWIFLQEPSAGQQPRTRSTRWDGNILNFKETSRL